MNSEHRSPGDTPYPGPEALADAAATIAREAGKLLMRELPLGRYRGDVEAKGGRELVSKVDRAAEALIRDRLMDRFPDHAIVGEELGASSNGEAPVVWIVDPLDGTTNFLHGHPFFAVSLAAQRAEDRELLAGVVYVPYFSELYVAARGCGAYMNTTAIRLAVSSTTDLADALVATGFAYDRDRFPNYDNFVRLAKASRDLRRCGSAAIDLAFVAAGRYDAFWELGLRAWDVAAGSLLIQEAGGRVGDFSGGDGWLAGGQIIATNGALFEAVQKLLDPVGA